jgi:phytoene dehydrogenase-like protein
VQVIEGAAQPGGGCRTAALTLPGFRHDVCAAVHPLATASPFIASLGLARRGAALLTPPVAAAHPLDGGRAGAVGGTVAQTAAGLGADDRAYRALLEPLARDADAVLAMSLAPLRSLPRAAALKFAATGVLPVRALGARLSTQEGRALLAGMAAHAVRPLSAPGTSAIALLFLLLAHAGGWPVVAGGSDRLIAAMAAELAERGAVITTGTWVRRIEELPRARAVLLDVTPAQLLGLAGEQLPARYRRALARFRYGPGSCKVDWALDGPVPWRAAVCRQAGTVHVGGTMAEVARSEAQVAAGRHPEQPFCLVAQPGVVDASRAPAGRHALWGYCHVPAGSTVDMTGKIEAQIERFAPGFRDRILARHVHTAADLERYNPGYVGGDVGAGAVTLRQLIARPVPAWNPYRTPLSGVYLCSASTPPGAGVHGMCGVWAARTALADLGVTVPPLPPG